MRMRESVESARDELEQFERAVICLVQIVKDYQQRCGTRDLLEQSRNRVEQPKARLSRIGGNTRRDGLCRQFRNQLRYLGRQSRVPLPVAALVENE